MRLKLISFFLFSFSQLLLLSQTDFNKYFTDNTLRYDFYITGNDSTEVISEAQIKKEPFWGGSLTNLIDTFEYGSYLFYIYDSLTDYLIYSRGFCTLFSEWKYTDEAKKLNRSFYETIVFPYPKKTVKLELFKRDYSGNLRKIFTNYINPQSIFINQETINYETKKISYSGDSHKKLDIVILPEGYTKDEMIKFIEDAKEFSDYLFNNEPFLSYKSFINVWAIEVPSEESGTDIPGESIWKNTAFNSHFYTFGTERYLTTFNIKSIRDAAANVPYDQIYILVNTDKYGGGGVYNYYSLTSAHHPASKKVFLHEFGHGFAGLADEYYTSPVAVEDFYSFSVEPWEPNITTLVNFDKKWKNMISKDTPVPTPDNEKYSKTVGVFEGAGYSAKNIYRPYKNCIMNSLDAPGGFCPVCSKAIIDMIKFYSE